MDIGAIYEKKWLVKDEHTAKSIFSGDLDVLATPIMIAWMENAAKTLVKNHMDDGKDTVGTSINIQHLAATPIGGEVLAKAVLVEVQDRKLKFDVEAFCEDKLIGQGVHERVIIDVEKFMSKLRNG